MALLGSLMKQGLAITQKLSFEITSDPYKKQENQLRELLNKAKNTSFGQYYGFSRIMESEDIVSEFKKSVPIFDYHRMNERWWSQQQKLPNITWPGKPDFFALSSGTTGKSSKRLPITSDFIKSMRNVGSSLITSLPNFNFPEELFESEILMLSSSANLSKHENGHLEGEISGINVSNFPDWYDLFYRPGKDIAAIADWDERVQKIAEEASNWNIGAIAGIPSWILLMLQKIIEVNKLDNIHQIWPNFTVYASGGVAFETYRKDFEKICGKSINIIDTYLASEGFFSYSARPETMDMQLALSHGYFYEFIPFDERGVNEVGELLDHPVSHNIDEVELDRDYVLIISTCAGAWRYAIGDVIKFTSLDPIEIKITGRTKFFLNVVGSQLSEEKMDKAILEVSDKLDTTVNEYCVGALQNENGAYFHQWVIVSDDKLGEDEFRDLLDDALKSANKNYKVARDKALQYIQVKLISKNVYHQYIDSSKKKGGQVKTPKVMTEEKMKELLKVIDS